MKKHEPKKHSTEWYEDFSYEDTRYYGVFLKGKKNTKQSLSVDMKRFCECFSIEDDRKNLKTNKNSQLFKPKKTKVDDYKLNIIKRELDHIKKEWIGSQKVFIDKFLSEIRGYNFTVTDDNNFLSGIADHDEAASYANIRTWQSQQYAEFKRTNLYFSLYAQYFHQLAAQIDAITLRLLTENGYEPDDFDRKAFLAFKGPKGQDKESSITKLESYKYHEKMYAIWNFIKHNSKSTYEKVKKHCPEVLSDREYSQGELACYYINFSNELIEQTIDGGKKIPYRILPDCFR